MEMSENDWMEMLGTGTRFEKWTARKLGIAAGVLVVSQRARVSEVATVFAGCETGRHSVQAKD